MNADMLVSALQELGDRPLSWLAPLVLFGLACWSLWRYRALETPKTATEAEAAEARAYLLSKVAQGPGHLLIMLASIFAMITGLVMVTKEVHPVIGFIVLVSGAIVANVEPLRVRMRIAGARLRAADPGDQDGVEAARSDLQDMHRSLVITLFVLTACVALALAVFS